MSQALVLRGRLALDVVRAHPRHVVLLALVAGMLVERAPVPVVLAAMLAAALAGGASVTGVLAAVAVMAGAVLAQERGESLESSPLPALVGSGVAGEVVLLEPPRSRPRGGSSARVRLVEGPARGEVALARLPEPRSAGTVEGAQAPELRVGEILRVSARVEMLRPWEEFQRRRGAPVALTVVALQRTGRNRAGLAGWLDAVRERGRRGLQAGPASGDAAVLRGMVLGEDHAIEEAVRNEFERSGLAHLLAVSGQNVMLLCVLVLALGAAAGVSLRARLAMALVLVALYVPITGAGPSIQRAGVMGAAGLVAALAGRPASRWYALILAAAITLALNPRAVEEPGWQLSFAAVIGLLLGAAPLTERLARRSLPRPVAEVTALTVLATVATAPLLVHHFGELSLVALPANLLAVPAVSPVMWLGMAAVAAAQVDPRLAAPLTAINEPFVAYIEWVAHVVAKPAFATTAVTLSWPLGVLGSYLLMGVSAFVCPLLWRSPYAAAIRSGLTGLGGDPDAPRRRVPVVTGIAVASALAAYGLVVRGSASPSSPRAHELVVSFLDVGQGDATLLQTDDASMLFDTGPPDGPILERLDEAGVERLDSLVITHAQADHEGAALAVMTRFRPRIVLNGGSGWPSPTQARLQAAARTAGSQVVPAHAGQELELDGIGVETLWPPALGDQTPSGDPNQRALVAHIRHGGFDLLLPADAESDVLAGLDLPRVEALKVSHHGSEDAGLPAVLERLGPAMAAIEVGRGNSYGHPAPSTLVALKTVPRVFRTDRDGTVRLRVHAGAMTVEP